MVTIITRLLYYSEDDDAYYESSPLSFLNFLFPSIDSGMWTYDGNGDTLCCDTKETAFDFAVNYDMYDYFDYTFDESNVKSKFLISVRMNLNF